MNQKTVRSVWLMVFMGMLFLQALFAGGVASEETGIVTSAMRNVRRVDNLHYVVDSAYGLEYQDGARQKQEVWLNLLDGSWTAEYTNMDADGAMTFLKEFCDGRQVTEYDYNTNFWGNSRMQTEIPNLNALVKLNYKEDEIIERSVETSDEGQVVMFTLTGKSLEKQRDKMLEELLAEQKGTGKRGQQSEETADEVTAGGMQDWFDLYYERYRQTRYENVKLMYTIDPAGILTGMKYSFDVSCPKIITENGTQRMGEYEQHRMGARVRVLEYNKAAINEKIAQTASEAGYDR